DVLVDVRLADLPAIVVPGAPAGGSFPKGSDTRGCRVAVRPAAESDLEGAGVRAHLDGGVGANPEPSVRVRSPDRRHRLRTRRGIEPGGYVSPRDGAGTPPPHRAPAS